MDTNEKLKNYTEHVASHLSTALQFALQMQQLTLETEGDSDLHRKIAYYLVPNLNLWLSGAQVGNVKDLRDLFAKRELPVPDPVVRSEVVEGKGFAVLTAPKKKKKK